MNVTEFVRYRLYKAILLEFRFTDKNSLGFQGGHYVLKDDKDFSGHPLEYFLLCEDEKALIGDWDLDMQNVLGVSSCWIYGFQQGYQEREAPVACADALEGYRCGVLVAEDERRWLGTKTSL